MGILRLLFYAAIVWLLYKLIKGLFPKRVQGPRRPDPVENSRPGIGELVQDPQCGVYIPKETALEGRGGRFFCGAECRDAYAEKGSSADSEQ